MTRENFTATSFRGWGKDGDFTGWKIYAYPNGSPCTIEGKPIGNAYGWATKEEAAAAAARTNAGNEAGIEFASYADRD
jgi:hypothetical protein